MAAVSRGSGMSAIKPSRDVAAAAWSSRRFWRVPRPLDMLDKSCHSLVYFMLLILDLPDPLGMYSTWTLILHACGHFPLFTII